MRKIITTTIVTLDGVMQAPGGSQEDTAGGFKYGGWQINFPQDAELMTKLGKFFTMPFEMLLGRITYDIFAAYWPTATVDLEVAKPFNESKKYVVSYKMFEPKWNNTTCISDDVVGQIKKLKEQDGPDLVVWGSGNLIQTLLQNKLIDQMYLWIHPITIGSGKKLFAEGTQPQNFRLVESQVGKTGLIYAVYEPAGPLQVN